MDKQGIGVIGWWMLCASAGGTAWAGTPADPHVGGPDPAGAQLRAWGGWSTGGVAAFQSTERDHLDAGAHLEWQVAPQVRLEVGAEGGRSWSIVGEGRSGPGALTLGTGLRPVERGRWPLDLSLGWRARLPWSLDGGRYSGARGTDELDARLLGAVGLPVGPVRVAAVLGLDILGNPLRFANQDDVPLAWLRADLEAAEGRAWSLHGRLGGGLPTARNPARLRASAAVEWEGPVLVGLEADVGLTVAAADWAGRLWVGRSFGGAEAPRTP